MITKNVKMYKPKVGMMSLVGILSKDRPVLFGNYCSISGGPYLANMWAENLEALDLNEIEVTTFSDGNHYIGLVTDKRIESNWFNHDLCVTGHGWGSEELKNAIYESLGKDVSSDSN